MGNVTWPELTAAMSLATDLGMAQPLESGLATCLVAVTLAERLGLDAGERDRFYTLSLLQHIGCTAATAQIGAVVGDELALRRHADILDFGDRRATLRFLAGHVTRTFTPLTRPAALVRIMLNANMFHDVTRDVCEAAKLLGPRCGYDPSHLADLTGVYEYWDGSGFPGELTGEAIPVPVRVVQVAALAVAAHRHGGTALAVELVRSRCGRSLAPDAAGVLLDDPASALARLDTTESLWDAVQSAAPATPEITDVDAALRAVADFVDLKSPPLVGHSRGVAELAATAADIAGLAAADVELIRHAGYVHDVGRITVSATIWAKPGPLRPDEVEQVRLHPYYTARVLDRTPYLRRLAEVASEHHERLDGTGYPRGLRTSALGMPSRILAAADSFHAMTEPRPYRAALSAAAAQDALHADAAAGRLDARAVDAVIAAGGNCAPKRTKGPAGLTARELDILAEVARGHSIREIAKSLVIAPKTVDGHLQRIYPKIGVSTRSGATLFALEHGLLRTGAEDREISP